MKSNDPQLIGSVIKYPYKWSAEEPENPAPKDRTACLLLQVEVENFGKRVAILAISDRIGKIENSSIEIPHQELQRAGLSTFRKAFVHIDHVNMDKVFNSLSYNPRQKILGSFSKAFLIQISNRFFENIKSRNIKLIQRS